MLADSLQITELSEEFEEWYAKLQANFEVDTHPEKGLVTAVSNQQQPIHRWYSLKEGYASELPIWVVNHLSKRYNARVERVVDPFVGGGTTGVSLALENISVDGIEYNPFIRLVAKVKSQYPLLKKPDVLGAITKIRLAEPENSIPVPELTTLNNNKYFRTCDIQVMLHTIAQIRELDADEAVKNLLLLGVAASIDEVAHLRKDGRALRYEKKTERPIASEAIQANWNRMIEDLEKYEYGGQFNVYPGTAVDLQGIASDGQYDLALYSPPYLNNFDYSEIYKLELWLLGYVTTIDEWRNVRKSTLRSHPSITFDAENVFDHLPEMADLYDVLKQMRDAKILVGERNEIGKILVGYFEDMYLAFKEQWRVLKPGGFLVYIVANSRHKYLPIATDVILGEIAHRIGFKPLDLIILKQRNGRTRQKTYLHESAVILQKPHN